MICPGAGAASRCWRSGRPCVPSIRDLINGRRAAEPTAMICMRICARSDRSECVRILVQTVPADERWGRGRDRLTSGSSRSR